MEAKHEHISFDFEKKGETIDFGDEDFNFTFPEEETPEKIVFDFKEPPKEIEIGEFKPEEGKGIVSISNLTVSDIKKEQTLPPMKQNVTKAISFPVETITVNKTETENYTVNESGEERIRGKIVNASEEVTEEMLHDRITKDIILGEENCTYHKVKLTVDSNCSAIELSLPN